MKNRKKLATLNPKLQTMKEDEKSLSDRKENGKDGSLKETMVSNNISQFDQAVFSSQPEKKAAKNSKIFHRNFPSRHAILK